MGQVYRHYDASGTLLYVGASRAALARLAAHESSSHWAKDIVTMTIERFPDMESAFQAEARAINEEGPLHNGFIPPPPAPKSVDALSDAERLRDALNQAMQQGALTIGEIAKETCVSRHTVGRLLDGTRKPNSGTRFVLWAYLREKGAV